LKAPESPTDWKSRDSLVFAAFMKILPDNPGIATRSKNNQVAVLVAGI
jgi:hypothetical protein